jgi:hypothetical protein
MSQQTSELVEAFVEFQCSSSLLARQFDLTLSKIVKLFLHIHAQLF